MKLSPTYFIPVISRDLSGSDNKLLPTSIATYLQPSGVATGDPKSLEDDGGL